MVASITTWFRLEPLDQSSDLQPSLTAPIADPLWLLHRQWQLGELDANDAGTPIAIKIRYEQTPLSRFHSGPPDSAGTGAAVNYDPRTAPLEPLVEAERVRGLPDQHRRLAAEAGVQFLRILRAAGLRQLQNGYRTLFPLQLPLSQRPEADPLGAEAAILLTGRALDGDRLAARLRAHRRTHGGRLASLPANFPTGDRPDDVLAAAVTWLGWYENLLLEPAATTTSTATPPSWKPRRFEYQFATGCRPPSGPLSVGATSYDDGYLDWPDLSVVADDLSAPATVPRTQEQVSIPVPLTYSGMPAHRHWEVEDSRVNFATIEAGSTDIVRMLLTEFALVYGDDWFVAPLPVDVGSLVGVTDVTVRDTFGILSAVPATEPLAAGAHRWAMFRQSSLGAAAEAPASTLLMPPTLVDTLGGPPLEEVAFFRDEMANVVWAVERSTPSSLGTSVDRYRFSQPTERVSVDVTDISDAELVYRMTTPVPTNWYAYLPKRAAGDGDIHLERLPTSTPFGVIADESSIIEDEEVSRGGVVVQRAWQYGRWTNGRPLLWLGRRVQAGRGEGSSGLAWDRAEAP